MSLYFLNAARSEKQRADMEDLERRGICIFCPEHIKEDNSPIEIETNHWMVKKNSFPYKNTKIHLLAIPKKHVKTMSGLSEEARKEFFDVVAACEKQFKLDSYGLVIRSGDMSRNGGSIEHIHAHIIMGDTDNPRHEPVRVKISTRPRT